VIIRPERAGDDAGDDSGAAADRDAIRAVHTAAFRPPEGGTVPVEAPLVEDLRAGDEWLPRLSLVADVDSAVVGHVVCTRGWVVVAGGIEVPALGLGPLGVLPSHQGAGVGSALMHAVLGAADALGERLVALLGEPRYYGRFGFGPAAAQAISSPDPAWGDYFQVRWLAAGDPALAGTFRYAAPFADL
jgi:putative acetyltransferase